MPKKELLRSLWGRFTVQHGPPESTKEHQTGSLLDTLLHFVKIKPSIRIKSDQFCYNKTLVRINNDHFSCGIGNQQCPVDPKP